MYNELEAKSVDVLMNYNTILRAYRRWQNSAYNVDLAYTYEQINQDHLQSLFPEESRILLSRKDIDDIEGISGCRYVKGAFHLQIAAAFP